MKIIIDLDNGLAHDMWPCKDLTLVIGNNSWKFHDDTMMGT